MTNFCVSFTSIPTRIDNIKKTIDSINNQSLKANKIFLNLPYEFKRFSDYKFNREQIMKIGNYNVEVNRSEDYGPATKLMGSISKIKNEYDCVILIDDDHIYHKNTFEILVENFKKEKGNYSYYLNKIFNIRNGQCSDGFLMNVDLLDNIEIFYKKYVKNNINMFLDDDLWFAIYLYCEKKSCTKNIIKEFENRTGENISYKQNLNYKIDALHKKEHKSGLLMNRRKIQKIEYIKFKFKKFFNY